ncbi:MAG: hydroxylamine reductase [Eubacterium sp.]|nr:hydroxylamine reductase [Eubacterium sp.]
MAEQTMTNQAHGSVMYCDQCQEAAANAACTRIGMCGISAEAAGMRDLLIYVTQGLASVTTSLREEQQPVDPKLNRVILDNLVMCTVNVNFDPDAYRRQINRTLACKAEAIAFCDVDALPEAARWQGAEEQYTQKAAEVGRMATVDPDIRGLRGLILYAMQGTAAYLRQANRLGKDDDEIQAFIQASLKKASDDTIRGGELIASVLEAGRYGIKAMTLLNTARAEMFGSPEAIEVDLGVRTNPGILVAGDDIKVLARLLEQTEGSGVDVYTYSDLLSAHAYPELSRYPHFAGNYGGAWHQQKEEFEAFGGPVLITSDEFTIPRRSYLDRVYTTGLSGSPRCRHIPEAEDGAGTDFSELIAFAKTCGAPRELERRTVVTGYGKEQLSGFVKPVARGLSKKEIRKLVVMIGTDGRAKNRSYYTDFVRALPEDTVVLAAGSVKYRFMRQELGETAGVPRLIDAGDSANSYSICDFLLNLQEEMNLSDVGMLPVYFNVAWYDPKSVITILELLYIGMKNIHLGPSSLNFLSRGIREVFVSYFGLTDIGDVDEEIRASFGDRGDSVTADMIVGDIVAQFPELVPVMLDVGLHCLGCGVSQVETLKEACEVHGLDIYDILDVLNDELKHPEEEDE